MKVLVVVHGFPPLAQGGSEIYAETHARALSAYYGEDVLVITCEREPAAPEYRVRYEDRSGIRVAWVNNTFGATRSFRDTYQNDAIGKIAASLIDSFEPDVAHVHHLTCLSTTIVESLSRRGVPCVFTLHDFWLLCHRGQLLDRALQVCPGPEPHGCDMCLDEAAGVGSVGFRAAASLRAAQRWLPSAALRVARRAAGRVARLTTPASAATSEARRRLDYMRGVANHVTHFLAPSRHIRDRFIEFGVAPDRITHVLYGFDHRPYDVSAPGTAVSHDTLRVGFLGSLMVSKAPHVLLEAYRGLEPGVATVYLFGVHVAYHGDDSYRERLAPLLEQPGVYLRGPVPHDRIPATLAALDILVVPSVWPENSPLVIHEAFLAGVPVVASRIGGIPELVSDGTNGLLFRPGDADDLRRALTRLVEDPELLARLRQGIPAIRTIEDDVATTRRLYQAAFAAGSTRSVVAVVLNYGTPDDTVVTVRSLLASRRPFDEVVVVDNDPSEDCRLSLATVRAHVRYIKTERNLGFSGGMNVGIRHALDRGASRVLLVNSDVFVPPDCLERLETGLDGSTGAGIGGPVVRSRSDPDRIASLGMSYSPGTGRMRHEGFGTTGDNPVGTTTVDAVSGCLMLVDREVFERVGLLDEDYFFSFEDLDFCLRAGRAGFRTVLVGGASVYHEGARSVGPESVDRLYYATRNHLLAATRAGRSDGLTLLRGLSIVALNLAHGLRFRGGSLPSRLTAVAAGARDYARARFGPR